MSWKIKTGLALVLCGLLAGFWLVIRARSRPAVTVTLRIVVQPAGQSDFVIGQANSAKFKYLIGKKSGLRPILAQKLSVKAVANPGLVEARVGVQNSDEGRLYAEAFIETLQRLCGSRAQLSLADQSIR